MDYGTSFSSHIVADVKLGLKNIFKFSENGNTQNYLVNNGNINFQSNMRFNKEWICGEGKEYCSIKKSCQSEFGYYLL
ncbi:hypothetical protein U3516DRAFT_735578 [Neocallimastix sp. 'constans']